MLDYLSLITFLEPLPKKLQPYRVTTTLYSTTQRLRVRDTT